MTAVSCTPLSLIFKSIQSFFQFSPNFLLFPCFTHTQCGLDFPTYLYLDKDPNPQVAISISFWNHYWDPLLTELKQPWQASNCQLTEIIFLISQSFSYSATQSCHYQSTMSLSCSNFDCFEIPVGTNLLGCIASSANRQFYEASLWLHVGPIKQQ